MEAFLEKENKTISIELKKEKSLKDILKELNISIDSVILVKNDEVCIEDEMVSNEDKIKLLSVVSGG